MPPKFWQIIKDDSKRTFEVHGQASNDNSFSNKVYAMQKAGMTVSSLILPVNNKTSSRDIIKVVGYTKEEGLYDRLSRQHSEINRAIDHW